MLTESLLKELAEGMTLKRLYHTGMFVRLDILHEGLEAEIKLHRAVLDRALLDCFHPNPSIKGDVDRWLDLSNNDFIESCDRADLSPRLVYEIFLIVKNTLKHTKHVIPQNFQQ